MVLSLWYSNVLDNSSTCMGLDHVALYFISKIFEKLERKKKMFEAYTHPVNENAN